MLTNNSKNNQNISIIVRKSIESRK